MTMHASFCDDPFFKDTWDDMEKSQRDFFKRSRNQFEESVKRMESAMKDFSRDLVRFEDAFPRSLTNLQDAEDLKVRDEKDKVELSLDTAGYKPDELKVTAGQGVVCVEGKHEEKSQSGEVMVSRQMSRQYHLPTSADQAQVTSNLSRDGVLVVTVPKSKQIKQGERNVPIEMNN